MFIDGFRNVESDFVAKAWVDHFFSIGGFQSVGTVEEVQDSFERDGELFSVCPLCGQECFVADEEDIKENRMTPVVDVFCPRCCCCFLVYTK